MNPLVRSFIVHIMTTLQNYRGNLFIMSKYEIVTFACRSDHLQTNVCTYYIGIAYVKNNLMETNPRNTLQSLI